MRKLKNYSLISILLLIGCVDPGTTTTDNTVTHYFNPQYPYSSSSATKYPPVRNLSAIIAPSGTAIGLTWDTPSQYSSSIILYKVYRSACVQGATSYTCAIPDPRNGSGLSNFYLIGTSTVAYYEDTTVKSGVNYTYWVYMYINGSSYSSGASVVAKNATTVNAPVLPSASEFWPSISAKSGPPTTTTTVISASTLSDNQAKEKVVSGGLAIAKSGKIAILADTSNNRLVLYSKPNYIACESLTNEVEILLCDLQYINEPFQAYNVLGQLDQTTNKACAWECDGADQVTCNANSACSWNASGSSCGPVLAYNECMTAPTRVYVDGSNLLVADGNDRIMIYDHIPSNTGCDTNVVPDQYTTRDCTPTSVLGKKNFYDNTNYSSRAPSRLRGCYAYTDTECSGDSACVWDNSIVTNRKCRPKYSDRTFNQPAGMVVDGSNLYVADVGNNRVVKIFDYVNKGSSCSSDWESTSCSFDGVIGQRSLFESTSLKDEAATLYVNPLSGIHSWKSCHEISSKAQCSGSCKWDNGATAYSCRPYFSKQTGLGNELSVAQYNLSKRLIESPTDVKILGTDFYITSNDSFFGRTRDVGYPVMQRARVLRFPLNLMTDETMSCTPATYDSGGCDASYVYGMESPGQFPIMYSGDSYLTEHPYLMDYIDSITLVGSSMVGVDAINNNVYLFNDVNTATNRYKTNGYASNPLGAFSPIISGSLPNLVSLNASTYDPTRMHLMIFDGAGFIYEIPLGNTLAY